MRLQSITLHVRESARQKEDDQSFYEKNIRLQDILYIRTSQGEGDSRHAYLCTPDIEYETRENLPEIKRILETEFKDQYMKDAQEGIGFDDTNLALLYLGDYYIIQPMRITESNRTKKTLIFGKDGKTLHIRIKSDEIFEQYADIERRGSEINQHNERRILRLLKDSAKLSLDITLINGKLKLLTDRMGVLDKFVEALNRSNQELHDQQKKMIRILRFGFLMMLAIIALLIVIMCRLQTIMSLAATASC